MRNRQQTYAGGQSTSVDFNQMRVGLKSLDDAVINLSNYRKTSRTLGDKDRILKAIYDKNYIIERDVSNYFFESSGIYKRLCIYLARFYRYDWYIVPYVVKEQDKTNTKCTNVFGNVLQYFDRSNIKQICGDIALSVIKNGAYYGYRIENSNKIILQELPIEYCRSRYKKGNMPAIELNLKYFDDHFSDVNYRIKVLKMFPKEIQKAYVDYRAGRLKPDNNSDTTGWCLLTPERTIKFELNGSISPFLVNIIPSIIDLDEAQALDRKKMMQQLLKIVIQQLPLDKNGDLIFDIDESKDLHNLAAEMLSRAVGVDVFTTFADTKVESLSDRTTNTTIDDLEKSERTVYNNSGVSQNLFNSTGNIALDKSVTNDESALVDLLNQFQNFFNMILEEQFNNQPNQFYFKFNFLRTTGYNYLEVAKRYKELVQLGYSRMLPLVALGHSQSEVLATAYYENTLLDLSSIMIPPPSSNTTSAQTILDKNKSKTTSQKANNNEEAGRPALEDDQKSDKTIQNKESM